VAAYWATKCGPLGPASSSRKAPHGHHHLAGLVLAAIVWAIGSHSSNPHLAGRGKSGVLVAFVAAVLIGGANVLVDFFVTTGKGL
jgi:hypothetical protein